MVGTAHRASGNNLPEHTTLLVLGRGREIIWWQGISKDASLRETRTGCRLTLSDAFQRLFDHHHSQFPGFHVSRSDWL